MATHVLMPALSPTMTEGRLSRWLKREGDGVAPGDVIAEIETDKATMEVEAVDEGTLGRILVAEGTDGVAVNTPIAVLLAEGESADASAPEAVPVAASASVPPQAKAAAVVSAQAKSDPAGGDGDNGGGGETRPRTRVFASPLARRIAQEVGVILDGITGSGPNGRIVRADVEAAAAGTKPAAATTVAAEVSAPLPAPAPAKPAAATHYGPHRAVPNSSIRRAIARRLTASKVENPHFYVSMDFELDRLLELRATLNAKSAPDGKPGAYKLSVNDMLIKAVAVAHRRVAGIAVTFTEEAILHYENIDISVAVSIPDGLITPIVRDADRKGLVAISHEVKDLVGRARTGKLKPEEYQGGAFSISNLGMFGVRDFTAIINPPQAAILAIGAGDKRAVVRGGALAVATVMTCTLSADHRAVDGALAAQWMGAFRQLVQDPLELML